MNSKVSFLIGLIFGAFIGSGITYAVVSKKKDEQKEEEICSIRDSFNKHMIEKNRIEKETLIDEYNALMNKLEYSESQNNLENLQSQPEDNNSEIDKIEEPAEPVKLADISESESTGNELLDSLLKEHASTVIAKSSESQEPYFIEYEEYGEIDRYNQVVCTYYTNGILVEDNYDVIDDPEKYIGKENMNELAKLAENGEYIAWIRNNSIMTDFEIQIAEYDFSD